MNALIIFALLLSCTFSNVFASIFFDFLEIDSFLSPDRIEPPLKAAKDALNSRDLEAWKDLFDGQPYDKNIFNAIDHVVESKNHENLRTLLNEYESESGFLTFSEAAARTAIQVGDAEALKIALEFMYCNQDFTTLMDIAFSSGIAEAVRIILKRFDFRHLKPVSPRPFPLQAARNDQLRVYFELMHFGYFKINQQTIQASPFLFQELSDQEVVRLLENIPANDWTDLPHYVQQAVEKACERGLHQIIQALLQRQISAQKAEMQSVWPYRLAIKAIIAKSTLVLSALLSIGMDVNFIEHSYEFTLVEYAIAFAPTEMVQMLIEHGANLCIFNYEMRNSLLASAAEKGRTDVYQMLIEAGASNEWTPSSKSRLKRKLGLADEEIKEE